MAGGFVGFRFIWGDQRGWMFILGWSSSGLDEFKQELGGELEVIGGL